MKIPSEKTIRNKINAYAYKCGFILMRHTDGSYGLFDIKMNYHVFRGSRDGAIRMVVDELHMMEYSKKNQPLVVGG